MKSILVIFFLLFTLNVLSQKSNDRPIRDSFTLIMPVTKETFYESHIQATPFVVGPKILQLFPGDTVFIEIEQKDGNVTSITSVKENKNKDKTVEISFIQGVENNKHSNMILKVRNPFQKDLSYEAAIRIMNAKNWAKTSIIPVKAQLIGLNVVRCHYINRPDGMETTLISLRTTNCLAKWRLQNMISTSVRYMNFMLHPKNKSRL